MDFLEVACQFSHCKADHDSASYFVEMRTYKVSEGQFIGLILGTTTNSSRRVEGNAGNSSESRAHSVTIGNDPSRTFSCLRCRPPMGDQRGREESLC